MGEQQERQEARVECQDCNYSVVVTASDDRLPADVVVEHGRKSGHKLSVRSIEH